MLAGEDGADEYEGGRVVLAVALAPGGESGHAEGGERAVGRWTMSSETVMSWMWDAKLTSSSSSSSYSSLSSSPPSISADIGSMIGRWLLGSWETARRRGSSLEVSGLSKEYDDAVRAVGIDMFLFSFSHLEGEGDLPLTSSPKNLLNGDHRPRLSAF